ncbi:MAG: ATP-binding protein [Chloroflexi bacterium]|nr:MAG: ATP-binding protein [Chloroflexota bacterium]
MSEKHPLALTAEQLSRPCTLESFDFENTSSLPVVRTIFGQPRGVRAMTFGLDIKNYGYNIYVLGPTDSDRVRTINQFVKDRASDDPVPDDWCYVHNFEVTHQPRALRLPAGQGRVLQEKMASLIERLKLDMPAAFNTDEYRSARGAISQEYDTVRRALLQEAQAFAATLNFMVEFGEQVQISAMHNGQLVTQEIFNQLSEEEQNTLMANRQAVDNKLNEAYGAIQTLQKTLQGKIGELDRTTARNAISQCIASHFGEALDSWPQAVRDYLEAVQNDMVDELDRFFPSDENQQDSNSPQMPDNFFRRYEVNVVVSNEPGKGAPVVYLHLPSYRNLVGRIEYEQRFGVLSTNHMQIRAGALMQANGGYLILRASDILKQPFAWDALKRTISTKRVTIEDEQTNGSMSVMAAQTLEPEPIPLNLTLILVGSQPLYYQLYAMDEDFPDLVRVKADFGETMARDGQAEKHYASFIATRCHEEGLPHFTAAAVGRLIEYGSWLISDQRKLSTEFGRVASIVREAAHFARVNGHEFVTVEDVEQAITERTYRNNEMEELAQERINDGVMFIDTDGEVIGQINGLVVMSTGDHAFGLPNRVTARVFVGNKGIVQIDRETEMAGPIHNKGVLTLQGYLGGRYALEYPMALTASITFEQSYIGVEGDSAAVTELYALLSALAQMPVKQSLAITGSVNQLGCVQPIGGVTQKVEGWFNACERRGLTGTQGAIIPRANIPHLMLSHKVREAVEQGKFHIYVIDTVDEGLELLMGQTAETVHEAVQNRLKTLAETVAKFEKNID